MPTLTQLQYVVAVDKVKHFGRAAKECHVSQPSLSAQIQKLEETLDLIVFDRSKQPIRTTDKGKSVVNQAKVILKEHQRLFDIQNKNQTLSGSFHLGVIPTLSSSVIPLFVESFSKRYPEVRLKISEYKTEDIVNKLYDDELDGGLLVTPLYDEKIIERSLFFEPFMVFSSDSHMYTEKASLKSQDLKMEDLWLLHEGHCFRDQVLRLCGTSSVSGALKNIDFQSGSLETIVNLIRRGSGYTLLPQLSVKALSDRERQKQLKPFAKPVPTREVSLVHSRSFLKEEIIAALVEEVLGSLPDEIRSLKKSQSRVIDI